MCLYEPINGDYPTESFCNIHGSSCEGCSYKYDESLAEDAIREDNNASENL